ncbi:UDP-N-acetylmuramoyl-tripeptide--D-alanyl-D-alanine ligase [Syntrophus gentianae]|uniref:UDP-N-acetylmuramoyl-tripeptide--D-alanyl-D-alanine ligase n=1 Tax=Syntrophus gentianae TaxID=43775 RepID=A0A1H7X6T3_9BACT|nr:UDP-N-acetylmuramoyl-tripeptide--D-alanyl-D-alanine ligase [Syntrophus gentianae]SEM28907.1 UDP-N-acetylmuramoyl-tripeptide--D-alanyl-D-alanine ligase [Syntrophus gentianae]
MNRNLMPEFLADELVQATGGRLLRGETDFLVRGVSTDTRQLVEGNLYIPLKGERFDGHDFLGEAIAKGAGGVLADAQHAGMLEALSQKTGSCLAILVEDTLRALGDIARFWRRRMGKPVIAITGSSGKTTTKEMTAAILGQTFSVLKTEGNLNNLIGLPLTLLRLEGEHDLALVELGTNARGEIRRLTEIAEPDIALVTNIGPAHLEGLKTLECIHEEKGDLYGSMSRSGLAVFNADDDALAPLRRSWPGRTLTYGVVSQADLTASDIAKEGVAGQSFRLNCGSESVTVHLSASGMHNIYNALAAAALSRASGIGITEISQGLRNFHPVSARFEVHRLPNGAFLVDDTYNANPASVREALKTIQTLKGTARSVAILADMLELGDSAEDLHESVGCEVAATDVGRLFLKGLLSRSTAAGAAKGGMPGERISYFENADEIIDSVLSFVEAGDWILVKGSRRMKMEEIVKKILDRTSA